jgi:hypothetical protein
VVSLNTCSSGWSTLGVLLSVFSTEKEARQYLKCRKASRVVSLKAFGLAEAPGGLIEYLQFWLEHPGCPLKCFQHREGGKTVSQVQKGI